MLKFNFFHGQRQVASFGNVSIIGDGCKNIKYKYLHTACICILYIYGYFKYFLLLYTKLQNYKIIVEFYFELYVSKEQ